MLINTKDMRVADILDHCLKKSSSPEAARDLLIELMRNDIVLFKKMVEPYLKMI
jgi:hypothetical protein